jgi:hypothetical protein
MTADSKYVGGAAPYEAIGKVIRKLPIQTKTETGTSFKIGFPVCEVTEYLDDDGAKAVAALLNRGDVLADLVNAAKRAAEVMERHIYPKPDVGPDHPYSVLQALQVVIARAEGRS